MARRDKAGPGPRVRPEQAALQGAPGPEAGAGTKEQAGGTSGQSVPKRSEEHTSELQSPR